MRLVRPFILVLVLCSVLFEAPAFAQSKEATDAASRLLVRSGLSVQLRGFSSQFAAQFGQQRGKLPDNLIIELTNAAKEAFRPDVLQEDIVQGIAKKLKVDEMNGALAWLDSPLGERITRAEEASSGTMDEAALRKFGESLKDGKPPAARAKLISDVIAASFAEDSTVRSLEAISLGVALGMDSMQPSQNRLGLERLQAKLKEAMPADKLKAQMRLVLPVMYAYTYRDIGDADLAAYAAFLNGPVGKRYTLQVSEAFMEALIRGSVRLGQLVDMNSTKRPT